MDISVLRLDDLQTKGYKLYQDLDLFCFGVDAVLLADYAAKHVKPKGKVFEMCSGNGVVSVLMCARREDLGITAGEIQKRAYELLCENVMLNSLESRIAPALCDIRKLPSEYSGRFDAVVVNPPYIPVGSGLVSGSEALNIARSEVCASLEDVVKAAFFALKDKGKLVMVHRAHRISEITAAMENNRLYPKHIRFIYPKKGSEANLVLICASKSSGGFTKVEEPLYVYKENGEYTDETEEIYARDVEK